MYLSALFNSLIVALFATAYASHLIHTTIAPNAPADNGEIRNTKGNLILAITEGLNIVLPEKDENHKGPIGNIIDKSNKNIFQPIKTTLDVLGKPGDGEPSSKKTFLLLEIHESLWNTLKVTKDLAVLNTIEGLNLKYSNDKTKDGVKVIGKVSRDNDDKFVIVEKPLESEA